MKRSFVFFRKELTELFRSGKLVLLGIIFITFGIMNAGIAKLTPMIMDTYADELAKTGMKIEKIEVDASTVWQQFFKNYSMMILVVVIMFAGIFAAEYTKGTLVLLITKGLPKSCVTGAKLLITELIWTCGYWLCFGVTYLYADIYWDNSIMEHLGFAVLLSYIFGIFLIAAMIFFGSFSGSMISVLLGTGVTYFLPTLLSMSNDLKKYMPTFLTGGMSLFTGENVPSDFTASIAVTSVLTIFFIVGAFVCGRKKVN